MLSIVSTCLVLEVWAVEVVKVMSSSVLVFLSSLVWARACFAATFTAAWSTFCSARSTFLAVLTEQVLAMFASFSSWVSLVLESVEAAAGSVVVGWVAWERLTGGGGRREGLLAAASEIG
eukprot:scaffold162712_cov60-Attheya_sp.AAC.3